MYFQLIQLAPTGEWQPVGQCHVIGEHTDTDVMVANHLAEQIRAYSDNAVNIALIDGMYESSITNKILSLRRGAVIVGYPPDVALCVLASMVDMHPLELGIGGDHDSSYRYRLNPDTVDLEQLCKESAKWMTSNPQER